MTEPKRAYAKQKAQAGRRGIGWELTFEQWWAIWERSGRYADRGTRHGQYVMARNWDAGPYAEWNVDIQLAADNVRTSAYRKRYRKPPLRMEPVRDSVSEWSGDPLAILEAQEESTSCTAD